MKKLFTIVLALVFMLSYTMSALAAGPTVIPSTTYTVDNYKVETIKETKAYQKLKLTNLITGEEEYLETFLKNGNCEYLSTNKEGRKSIEKIDGTINVTNLDTKEVKYIEPAVVTSNTVLNNNGVIVPQVGGWDGIGSRWYSNTGTVLNDAGATAAVIALACKATWVTNAIMIAAVWAVNHFLPSTYWYQDHFVDSYDNHHFRDDTFFFKYSNYTDLTSISTFIYYTDY